MSAGMRDELCGCLIGLARTCSTNPPTEDTEGLLLAGLAASEPGSAFTDEQIGRLIDRVKADKARVSPNCVTCTSRCGKNDDYDMARLYTAPENIRQVKSAILNGLRQLARCGRMSSFVYDALFALAEDWDENALAWYRDEAQRLLL